jgi:hypothetical protein
MSMKPKVALSQDLLGNLAKFPSAVQNKVLKWAIKFQSDPTSSGINYENIQAARDANLKSVRIDQDWRGIVFKPSQGDVYVLLYVDHHDAAYRWAENRRIAINPVTGAMQIVVTEEVTETVTAAAGPSSAKSVAMFGAFNDRELVSIGTPEEMLPQVRAIATEEQLDALQPFLPVEAYEGLFLLAAGDTVNQILASRETRVDQTIDTTDFAQSLERAESQSRFVIVEDDEALTAIMNAPLAQWRVFLHPTQRKLATANLSGPARVLGGAGTGKTVLAMHRAKWLAEQACPADQKVLFTTFTRNLAADIEENLKSFCSSETLKKIEIKNLDAWVYGFLRSRRYEHRIVYDRKKEAPEAWQKAMALSDSGLNLPDDFYENEWEQVVLAQGITTRDEYRAARRAGRGTLLSRAKRDAIWPVFEEYRQQLSSRKLKEVDDAYRDAAALLASEPGLPYAAIVIDETQDFGPQALKLLRAMVPATRNDLFFVGDGHQRIYSRNKAALGRCGIDIRGRARKLYLNYRTTDEIRRTALAYLDGCEIDDLDEGPDENRRYKSLAHGPRPFVEQCGNIEEAEACLLNHLDDWRGTDSEQARATCVIAPTRSIRDHLKAVCEAKGWKSGLIEANDTSAASLDTVWFSTMHRAKGLEFDQVIALTNLQTNLPAEETADKRRLLYVALTRAKRRAGLILL